MLMLSSHSSLFNMHAALATNCQLWACSPKLGSPDLVVLHVHAVSQKCPGGDLPSHSSLLLLQDRHETVENCMSMGSVSAVLLVLGVVQTCYFPSLLPVPALGMLEFVLSTHKSTTGPPPERRGSIWV